MTEWTRYDQDLSGDFWDFTNPKKPIGLFDPADIIDIPFIFTTFLTGLPGTYLDHEVTLGTGLEEVTSSHNAGVITVRIKKATGATLTAGTKLPVSVRIDTVEGQSKEMSGYLKVIEM